MTRIQTQDLWIISPNPNHHATHYTTILQFVIGSIFTYYASQMQHTYKHHTSHYTH